MRQSDDVVIVGAGPVGATLALSLADKGVRSVVVERRTQPQTHPAAHVLTTRSLEIWRELGLERELRRLSAPLYELRTISYCTTLAGPELGRVPVLELPAEQLDAIESISPTRGAHLPQHVLEHMLWERLRANALIDFEPGWQYCGQAPDGDRSVVTVRRDDETAELRPRYVIGADGAGSAVRRELGIAMTGPVLQHMVSVHFAADLERFYRNRRGPVLWTHTPKGLGTFIVHRPPDDLVFQLPYFPPIQSLEDFPPEVCRRHIVNAIGDDSVEVTVKSVQSWAMTAQVADRYQSGRSFLVGDAAHRFPPTGGRGMNTGIADAHNLAWKLAWVLTGRADAALLDTYEVERLPLGQAATDDSVHNFDGLLDVLAALGLPRKPMRTLPSALERIPSGAPRWVLRLLLGVMTRLGYQRLRLAAGGGRLGDRVRKRAAAAIALQGPHYRSWGADLGGVYRGGAVVTDQTPYPPSDPEFYTPTTRGGGRLPHAWLDDGPGRRSTLDLVRSDCPTLLTPSAQQQAWAARVPPAVAVVALGAATSRAAPYCLGPDEALLVRPDHHIVARLRLDDTACLDDALRALRMTQGCRPTPQELTA